MQPNKSIPLALHLPETTDAMAQLARQRSVLHAELILAHIQSLPCPAQQREWLAKQVVSILSAKPLPTHKD